MAQAFDKVMSALFHRNVTKAEAVRAAELKLEKLKKAVADHTQSNLKDLRESLKMQEEAAGRSLAKLTEEDRPEGGYGKVETSFYKAAQTLSGPTGDYWRRPTEMFARSFESYVFDRLEGQSDYLVHGVEEDKFTKEKGRTRTLPAWIVHRSMRHSIICSTRCNPKRPTRARRCSKSVTGRRESRLWSSLPRRSGKVCLSAGQINC
jgi:hypothetical protein